jgi:hypothetical protein
MGIKDGGVVGITKEARERIHQLRFVIPHKTHRGRKYVGYTYAYAIMYYLYILGVKLMLLNKK